MSKPSVRVWCEGNTVFLFRMNFKIKAFEYDTENVYRVKLTAVSHINISRQ